MRMMKKEGGGIAFARKEAYEWEDKQYEADLQEGDMVTIKNAGSEMEGQHGRQHVFAIETRNGEKNLALNQSTINVLVDSFGVESEEWVEKKVKVLLKKDTIAGKKVIIAYLVTDGWYLDDFGDLVNDKSNVEEIETPF